MSPLAAATSRQTLARPQLGNKPLQNGPRSAVAKRKLGADLRRIFVPFGTCYKPRRNASR